MTGLRARTVNAPMGTTSKLGVQQPRKPSESRPRFGGVCTCLGEDKPRWQENCLLCGSHLWPGERNAQV